MTKIGCVMAVLVWSVFIGLLCGRLMDNMNHGIFFGIILAMILVGERL